MAAATKASVKSHFQTGDVPTQAQFEELIDSYQDVHDVLTAIATAAQGGATGVVVIEGSADVTTRSLGAFGATLIGAATTAAGASFLNAMTLDTTQTITGAKTFQGQFTVSASVTIRNTNSNATLHLINTDATAGTAFTPRINFQRLFGTGDLAAGDCVGGFQWEARSSAGSSNNFTWADFRTVIASADASAGGAFVQFETRVAGEFHERMRIGSGVVVSGATLTGGDLGRGTVNAERIYDDGRQIAPNLQAFAWAVHPGTGTPSLTNSINIASIVDNGVGDYSLVFSTAASDANYGITVYPGVSAASSPPTSPTWSYVHTTTAGGCRYVILRGGAAASAADVDRITVNIWDDNPSAGTRVP